MQQAFDDGHIFLADKLVRHEDAAHPVLIGNKRLMRGCKRDSPSSSLQLHLKQSWSHRGLAMRRKLNTISIDELLHPVEVVQQLVFVQYSARQAEVLLQQAPAE